MKHRVPLLVPLLILFFLHQGVAQSFKTVNKKANELFIAEQYEYALPLFLKMDSVSPGSGELNYRIGL